MNEHERREMIARYLSRLDGELRDVPAEARRDLVEDVRGHIEEAWRDSPTQDRAAMDGILSRLGRPEDLAREERERLGLPVEAAREGPDPIAILAVVLVGLSWPLGLALISLGIADMWILLPAALLTIAGLILVWASPRWYTRDKAIATLVLVAGVLLFFSTTLIATTSGSPQPAVVREVPVGTEQGGQPPQTEALPSLPSQPEPWRQLLGVELAIYGLVGTAPTAALYLALRMRPRPRRPLVVATALLGAVAAFALVVAFLTPVTVTTSADSGQQHLAPVYIQQEGVPADRSWISHT